MDWNKMEEVDRIGLERQTYKILGIEPGLLVYATDRFYDPSDEGRIPYDDSAINYDWSTQHK